MMVHRGRDKRGFEKCGLVGGCALALLPITNQAPCRAEGMAGAEKVQIIQPFADQLARVVDSTDKTEVEISGLLLTFVDSVRLDIGETLTGTEASADPSGSIAVESLSERDNEWLVELDEAIPSDAWVGILAGEGRITIFAVTSLKAWKLGALTVEGTTEFTGAWLAYVDAEGLVQTARRTGQLSNFPVRLGEPWVDSSAGHHVSYDDQTEKIARTTGQRDRQSTADESQALLDDGGAGDPAAVYCCAANGVCSAYGGGCPAGTQSVGCPCRWEAR